LVSLWLRFATQARIAEIKEAVNTEMKVRYRGDIGEI